MKIVGNWMHDCEWGVVPYMHKSLELLDDGSEEEL